MDWRTITLVDVRSYSFVIPPILVGLILVWVWFKFQPTKKQLPATTSGKSQVLLPIALVVFNMLATSVIYSLFSTNPFFSFLSFQNFAEPDATFRFVIASLLLLVPAIIAIRVLKASFRSVRLSIANIEISATLGAAVSLILLVPTAAFSTVFVSLLLKADFILVLSSVYSAFCEELLFRGLLQTRMEAVLGSRTGLLVTAIIFNLYHAPGLIMVLNRTPAALVADVLLTLPTAILLGYLSQKSDNILGSMIFHIAYNLPIILMP